MVLLNRRNLTSDATPGEHKTVQARILAYAEAIGWTIESREGAEERRAGFPTRRLLGNGRQECPPSVARAPLSLFFDDLLDAKVREFKPRYAEAEGALPGTFRHPHTDIYGNRERNPRFPSAALNPIIFDHSS